MARAGWALAFLAALPLLAGCVSPGNAVPDLEPEPLERAGLAVAPSRLEAGTFYAFRHVGGGLSLGVLPGGRAQVELFDGEDQRLGQLSLSDALAGGRLELQNMPAGDYVIRMLAVNGTLRLASGGAAPALRPLAAHIERHILAQAPRATLPTVPGLPGSSEPVTHGLDVRLLRAPTSLRLLTDADYSDLEVELRSPLGPVLSARSGGFNPVGFSQFGDGLGELSSEFHGENVRDGHLTGHLRAQDLGGTVVLEAASFSRAEPLAPPAAFAAEEPPRFTYGVLPDAPVRFQTGPRATQLLLHANPFPDGNRTWVVLFDDRGARLGALSVATGSTVAVPVAASTGYIAVRLRGNATLGANGAPGDFELHPMAVRETVLPGSGAGDGEYGKGTAEADGTGVFAIVPTLVQPDGSVLFLDPAAFRQCGSTGLVRVTQGGETLDSWQEEFPSRELPETSDAELRLRDGPLQVHDDGYGNGNCPRAAALLKSFEA